MKTYQDYIKYWENIAKQHEDIKHDPNDANNKKFFRINIEETITGFRNEIAEKEIVMVLINYAFDNDSINPSNVMSTIKYGFMIIGHAEQGDDDAQALLMAKTEDIVKQIIARANLESGYEELDGTDFWYNSLNEDVNFYSTPVNYVGDGNYHGWLVTGEFKQAFDCRVDVSQWADLEIGDMGIIDIPPFIDCAPVLVKNSDGSYSVSVPSGDTHTLPDITVTDSDGTQVEVPAGVDFVCAPGVTEIMTVDFEADKLTAEIGEDISFTDLTDKSPINWYWDFGDGTGSTLKNPTKSYMIDGTYDIALMAAKVGLGNVLVKAGYITIETLLSSLCSYYFNGFSTYIIEDNNTAVNDLINGSGNVWSARMVVRRLSYGVINDLFSNWSSIGTNRSILARFASNNKFQIFFSSTGASNDGNYLSSFTFTNDDWHDIVLTYNNGVIKFYVDGVEDTGGTSTSIPTTISNIPNEAAYGIANIGGTLYPLEGYINQTSWTSDEITSAEATTLWNGGSPLISSENIDNVAIQYLFDTDTWNGSQWEVKDTVSGNDALTINMESIDKDCNENPY